MTNDLTIRVPAGYLLWAHGPAAEDGHPPAVEVVELAWKAPRRDKFGEPRGMVEVPAHLFRELLSVARIWDDGGDAPRQHVRTARNIQAQYLSLPHWPKDIP